MFTCLNCLKSQPSDTLPPHILLAQWLVLAVFTFDDDGTGFEGFESIATTCVGSTILVSPLIRLAFTVSSSPLSRGSVSNLRPEEVADKQFDSIEKFHKP